MTHSCMLAFQPYESPGECGQGHHQEMRDSLDIIDSTAVEHTIGPWLMAKWSGYLQRSNVGDVFSGHSAETTKFSRLP